MGNTKQALQLIMTELKDVSQATDFCKEHSDKELWEDLIAFSIDKPDFITGLLNNIGTHVDPIILIRKIRSGMKIPGLRDSLVRILQDYNLQVRPLSRKQIPENENSETESSKATFVIPRENEGI